MKKRIDEVEQSNRLLLALHKLLVLYLDERVVLQEIKAVQAEYNKPGKTVYKAI